MSRDPIAERGGKNLFGFVGNNANDHLDPLGEIIRTKCRIDKWLKDYVGIFTRAEVGDYYEYSSASGIVGPPLRSLIVKRMINSKTKFTPKEDPNEIHNLKLHVGIRLRIVNEATAFTSTSVTGCFAAAYTIYASAYSAYGVAMPTPTLTSGPPKRIFDGVWIPGDWGYIWNVNSVYGTWSGLHQGEHIVWVGIPDEYYAWPYGVKPRDYIDAEIETWQNAEKTYYGKGKLRAPYSTSAQGWYQPGVGLQLP